MKIVPYRRERNLMPAMSVFDNFMNRIFEDEAGNDIQRAMALDIIEEDDKFIIEANLPGFKKDDISIGIEENELIIEAKKEEKNEEKKGSYCRCERYHGNFRRVLSLSDNIDRDKIDAAYEDGVLIIKIPKVEPQPAKRVQIK
ncbi:MAG: Hsp20/alpha crystallin family protein [Candidatus Cloacimonetes bacterium]|nr:Hsp20/alpha crystallin family protein [Candidatus Cloacimonadota bacterium]